MQGTLMRRLPTLCIIACIAHTAFGAKRLTVDQLRHLLNSADRAHCTDADLAHQIGDSELSQRLTSSTLERLGKRFQGHPQVGIALQLLADQSAFLDPPADELPKLSP